MPDEPRDEKDLKGLPSEEELERQLREMGFDDNDEPEAELPPLNPAPEMSVPPRYPEAGSPGIEQDPVEARIAEIDERIKETARERDLSRERLDREFEARVTDLEARAKQTKEERDAREREAARRRRSAGSDAKGMGVGMSIAYAIIGLPLLGAAIGWLVQQQTGSGVWVSLGVLAGAVLGVVFAIVQMGRAKFD